MYPLMWPLPRLTETGVQDSLRLITSEELSSTDGRIVPNPHYNSLEMKVAPAPEASVGMAQQ